MVHDYKQCFPAILSTKHHNSTVYIGHVSTGPCRVSICPEFMLDQVLPYFSLHLLDEIFVFLLKKLKLMNFHILMGLGEVILVNPVRIQTFLP
jgi:hypothetical protein